MAWVGIRRTRLRPSDMEPLLQHLQAAPALRLLVVSDSHGRIDGILDLLARTGQPDLILHLGDHQDPLDEIAWATDCPVLGVAGNCDSWPAAGSLPDQRLVILAGRRFFLAHGHRYQVKNSCGLLVRTAVEAPFQADVILFGHTHHQMVHQQTVSGRPVWLANPGSAFPGRGGPQGIWLEVSPDEIRLDLLPDSQRP